MKIIRCLKQKLPICFSRWIIRSVLMANLSKAKAKFASAWESEGVEQIVPFQSKCLSLDKNLPQFSYTKPEELQMFFRSWTSCLVLELWNIWSFWIPLFPLAWHLLMFSGFCGSARFQAWSSGRVLDLVAWEDSGHCVLYFDLLFPTANEFWLFHFTLTSCTRKCNQLSNVEQYVCRTKQKNPSGASAFF